MSQKLILKIAAVIWGISGVIILIGVFYPLISYQFSFGQKFSSLVSPIDSKVESWGQPTIDNTRASNWFVGGAKPSDFVAAKVSYYTLSVPKLKIENAIVAIGGEDLSNNLIQYPGTALPGKRGNAVIFGHSILPIFYNPKDYIAIFSTLPTLKKGNEIFVNYDGVNYKYRVEDMFEVLPSDIQVLQQNESDSFLTLVTCVPPGDPRDPKRLIVRARIVVPE
jgi:sortase A